MNASITPHHQHGKTRRSFAYYTCAPKKGYVPEGHPSSFWVREAVIVDRLNGFLTSHVFGAYRRTLLDGTVRDLGAAAQQEREQRLAALRREIDETKRMIKNVVRSFALIDSPTEDLMRGNNEQRAELHQRKAKLEAELAETEQEHQQAPNPDLLDALPLGEIRIEDLPEDVARRLFEALRLELHFDRNTNQLTCAVNLIGQVVPAARKAANEAIVLPFDRKKRSDQRKCNEQNKEDGMSGTTATVPILGAPPAGLEPAT